MKIDLHVHSSERSACGKALEDDQVRAAMAAGTLGDHIARRYPERHTIQTDRALYDYTAGIKQEYLRSAPPLHKVGYDARLDTAACLALHSPLPAPRPRAHVRFAFMKKALLALFQLCLTAVLLWWVFHDPVKQQVLLDAIRQASAVSCASAGRNVTRPGIARNDASWSIGTIVVITAGRLAPMPLSRAGR